MFDKRVTLITVKDEVAQKIYLTRVQINHINKTTVEDSGKERNQTLYSVTIPEKLNSDNLYDLDISALKYAITRRLKEDLAVEDIAEMVADKRAYTITEIKDNRMLKKLPHIRLMMKC